MFLSISEKERERMIGVTFKMIGACFDFFLLFVCISSWFVCVWWWVMVNNWVVLTFNFFVDKPMCERSVKEGGYGASTV